MTSCSKVNDGVRCANELDTTGSPTWCKSCRAKYQKEYQATRVEKHERTGYAKGITALRALLVEEFTRLGTSNFSGDECAYYIMHAKAPQIED